MVSVKIFGPNIDFVGNSKTELTVYFSIIILNFVFTPIFDFKISEKKTSCLEKNFLGGKILLSHITADSPAWELNSHLFTFSDEECGEMWQDGKWNDQDCDEVHPYVCKKLRRFHIKFSLLRF